MPKSRKRRRPVAAPNPDLAAKQRFLKADKLGQELRAIRESGDTELIRRVNESLMMNGQEFVNRYDSLPIGFGFEGGLGLNMSPFYRSDPNQRFEGQDWPFYVTQQDVDYARGMARFITTVQAPAVGIQENLLNYIIGTGPTVAISAQKHANAPEGLVPYMQDLVDEFLKENAFPCNRDRELFWRTCRDGDSFLAFYPQTDGFTKVRFVEPELVLDPGALPWTDDELWKDFGAYVNVASNCRFGIHTADHDPETVFGYTVQWTPGEGWDYLPARYVEHWKVNRDSTVKRGLTDFYPCWQWINSQAHLLANTAAGATKLSAIAYILQCAQASQQQMADMRAASADMTLTISTPSGGTKRIDREFDAPGSVLTAPKGMEYLPGPSGAERGNAFLSIVQGLLRQAAVRFGMSEGMISGDDSANNRASMAEAGSRFHQFAIARQGMFKYRLERIIWKAVEFAYEQGVFRRYGFYHGGETFRELKRVVGVQIELPDVDPKRAGEATQRRSTMRKDGVLSVKSYQIQEGLDPEEESENMKSEPQPGAGGPGGPSGPGGGPGGPEGGLPPLGSEKSEEDTAPQTPTVPEPQPASPLTPTEQQPSAESAARQVSESLVSGVPAVIEVPDVRQDDASSCGPAATMAVGLLYGVGPKTLAGWKSLLGTTEQEGTPPGAIVDRLGELGLSVIEQHRMSLEDLSCHLEAGRPVLCPVQDYDSTPEEDDSGHWLTVIGRVPGSYVICQDSSEDNVMHVPGGTVSDRDADRERSLAAPGRVLIREQDWLRAWHDRDAAGRRYVRYGIAVGPPRSNCQTCKGREPVELIGDTGHGAAPEFTQFPDCQPIKGKRLIAFTDLEPYMPPRKFASTQIDLPPEIAERVLALGQAIDDDDLASDGREAEPHVTVRWGLETDDSQDVRDLVAGFGPVRLTLGHTSIFPAHEAQGQRGGEQFDVVKVEVASPDLERLNALLADLPHTDTHQTYVPHVTLAHVKPGCGTRYSGMTDLEGVALVMDTLTLSGKDRARTDLPLSRPVTQSTVQEGWVTLNGGSGEGGHGGVHVQLDDKTGAVQKGPSAVKQDLNPKAAKPKAATPAKPSPKPATKSDAPDAKKIKGLRADAERFEGLVKRGVDNPELMALWSNNAKHARAEADRIERGEAPQVTQAEGVVAAKGHRYESQITGTSNGLDTPAQSAAWHNQHLGPVTANYSQPERDAIATYAGGKFTNINDGLRGTERLDKEDRQTIQQLDQVLAKSPLPAPVTVYRGIPDGASLGDLSQLQGKVLRDPGYSSTSTLSSVANGFANGQGTPNIRMEIALPKGFPAISTDAALGHDSLHQHELILPRGTKYQVTGVERRVLKNSQGHPDGEFYVLQVTPQTPQKIGESYGPNPTATNRQPAGNPPGGGRDRTDCLGPLLGPGRLLEKSQPDQVGRDVLQGGGRGTRARPTGGRPYELPWERATAESREREADVRLDTVPTRRGPDGGVRGGGPVFEMGPGSPGPERLRHPGDLHQNPAGDRGTRGLATGPTDPDRPDRGAALAGELAGSVAESYLRPAAQDGWLEQVLRAARAA